MWFFQLPGAPERALRWRDYAMIDFLWGMWSPGWDYPESRVEAVKETFDTGETTVNALQYYRDTVGSSLASLLGGDRPSLADVPPVRTPTLVLCGADDGCIAPELFDHAGRIVDECRVVRVRDAGHFVHQERPQVVGDEIASWI